MMIRRESHFGRVVPCLAERPPSVDALFRAAAAAAPAALAVIDGARRLTYGDLDWWVGRLANGLAARGLRKGDRLATLIGNRTAFVELSLACARLGLIHVPLNTRQRRPEIEYALTQSGASALVHEAAFAAELPDPAAVPGLRLRFAVDGTADGSEPYEGLMGDAEGGTAASPAGEEDPVCILYTSGTTGRPKGAVLSNLGVVQSCLNYRDALGLGPADRMVLAVPAAHVTGLVGVVHAILGAGGCLIVMPQFKARAFLELVEREAVTATLMVPAMYNLCLLDPEFDRFDLSSWRVGAFGGAPMPEATARRMKDKSPGLTLFNVYGSTETSSPVTILPRDSGPERLNSVGTALPTVDVRIMDEEGREVPPGEPGELWIAGSTVVPGYWNNPEADASAFVGGYWRSGDIGSIDEAGFVHILDRKKDMINRAGYKIYSAEVEDVLTHHPGVAEVAVVGYPDPVLGERVQAFVVTRRDTSEEELRRFCAERLSDYKVPDRVTFVEGGLPRNPNGKLLKTALRTA
ncbi:acyl-CoA synthetase (AMP-forming)/AMP-acid ligase II [Azospirillum agricola]|uniref:class I adenylate-forming enzyme family protein n=1 Tax=Azospirillum agricola TaxID=1720247 RepID=UPI001AE35515|nr:AMP-binding protein [Azospirillum agricola]MBP2231058.1 acyl-CoA synthetase (AMP-forming)/AMP-acid ligase II [Azospirillum agricola]